MRVDKDMNAVTGTIVSGLPNWLRLVKEKVASLHFGVVQVVVHDSRVVQIERTEKWRLDKPEPDQQPFKTDARQNTGGGI